MTPVDVELGLVMLAAMLSPTTLTFSVLALVLGERPLRTGVWFFLGAFGVTLAIGVVAALVLGDAAASRSSTPKTWVAVLDVVAGVLLLAYLARAIRGPANPARVQSMIMRMESVASSPAIAIVGAGAALANPGGFIPIALKDVSQLNPSAFQYGLYWLMFSVAALLPMLVAIVSLVLEPERAGRALLGARGWLERNATTIALVIIFVLALALMRNGIAGLTA
ncbi:MAG TPA: GAP family protein [Solirubrobacteraceae bacterium]